MEISTPRIHKTLGIKGKKVMDLSIRYPILNDDTENNFLNTLNNHIENISNSFLDFVMHSVARALEEFFETIPAKQKYSFPLLKITWETEFLMFSSALASLLTNIHFVQKNFFSVSKRFSSTWDLSQNLLLQAKDFKLPHPQKYDGFYLSNNELIAYKIDNKNYIETKFPLLVSSDTSLPIINKDHHTP